MQFQWSAAWLGILLDFYADVGFLSPQHFITLNLHAFAEATAFFHIQVIKKSLGHASGKEALFHSNLLSVWRHNFHSQTLFTWYYEWWIHLIISQVGIIFEPVRSGSGICWLGTLLYLYVTLLDHADVGFLSPQHFITLNLHAFAGATAFFGTQNMKNSLGNAWVNQHHSIQFYSWWLQIQILRVCSHMGDHKTTQFSLRRTRSLRKVLS